MQITEAHLAAELADALDNVSFAEAALTRARDQLANVKLRHEALRSVEGPMNAPYERKPEQLTIVVTAKHIRYKHTNAVKAIRECTWLGLKEAKDLMESELPIRIKVTCQLPGAHT